MDADQVVDVYASMIRDDSRVLVFPHVDNVVGLRHPPGELTRMARERVGAAPWLEWRSPDRWERGASLVAVRVHGRPAGEPGATLYRDHGVVVRSFGGGGLDHVRVSPDVMTTDAELDRFFRLLGERGRP